MAAVQVCVYLSLVFLTQAATRPRQPPLFQPPFLQAESRTIVESVHAMEDFVGGLLNPIFGGGGSLSGEKKKNEPQDTYGVPVYEAPARPTYTHIPCGEYGNRRSFIGVLAKKPGEEDDCGVYEATSDGFEYQDNCEYVHETVFVTKYKTECSKTYSTQCQTSYKTECATTISQECRTEYQEECSYADIEECITVDRPNYEEVCTTEYVEQCDGGGYKNSYEAPPACSKLPKQVCNKVAKSNLVTECTKVPKRSCVTSPRETCGEVPKQDCKLVPTSTNCKDIPEKLCRQRAYQYPESTSRQVCGLGPQHPQHTNKDKKKENKKKFGKKVKK